MAIIFKYYSDAETLAASLKKAGVFIFIGALRSNYPVTDRPYNERYYHSAIWKTINIANRNNISYGKAEAGYGLNIPLSVLARVIEMSPERK